MSDVSHDLARGCESPLCREYDTALLDLDGVVYVGPDAVEHAAPSLFGAVGQGMRLAYVTNNASRTPETVAKHLSGIGMPAVPEDVVTSAQAASRLAFELYGSGAPVLVVGGEGLRTAVEERGLRVVASAEDNPHAVLQGYSPEVNWLDLAEISYAVARGVPWIATNTDATVPTPRGLAPGNGTLVGVVRTATGVSPMVAGKPSEPLFQEALSRTRAGRPLMIGDRLDTDVQGARAAGIDSLLVLTGATDPTALVAAPEHARPTYLAADLRDLLAPHAGVVRRGEVYFCGGWSVTSGGDALSVSGNGDPCDGLRAICVAAWSTDRLPDPGRALASVGL
ncbi:HAD-IIA family hydrolase [Streptomyces sp. DSM 42041]|uniref:HAD-IIA family hydrolase n=1 Tax=Streptomyces hazeniae TaxID=3075538 RepID=A0ABU2NYU7_9ACTN|nr:HAD-IIA family hydrolase [Streptomyces sp. DSM 42041]MDT0382167.1 HAD-IIA family hydrolase [Streptomyces sp. DSM 42041]